MSVPPVKAVMKVRKSVEDMWNIIFNEHGWDPWFTSGMKVDTREGGSIFFRWIVEGEEVTDRGISLLVIPMKLWEFQWNEYEDGFRSRTTIRLHEASDGETWVEIEDMVMVLGEKDLEVAFSCAVGWGEFMTRLKLYAEKGLVME